MPVSTVVHRYARHVVVCGIVIAALTGIARAGDEPAGPALPIDRGMMQRLSNFTLKDVTNGRSLMLYGFQGRKAIVLVFLGNDCPVVNLYVPRLIELNHEFSKKGVVMLGINSNAHETEADVAKFVKETGIDFPVLKDPQNLVADAALVERTAEVIVLDGFARIVYRGAIDDQHLQGKSKDKPDHNYLRDALTALVSGGKVPVRATTVAGCLLDRVAPKPIDPTKVPKVRGAAPAVTAAPLPSKRESTLCRWARSRTPANVATILQNKCQACHRPGQVAPFSLLTYDDARKHSAMIREVVAERRMPPWHADPQIWPLRQRPQPLSAQDRATLLAWVEQGTPLGEAKEIPPPRSFPEGWTIGKPDQVFEIPEPYYVPAQGVVSYVYFRVPTNFKEDRWVQAAEAVPGDRSVVHHIIVYLFDPTSRAILASGSPTFAAMRRATRPRSFPREPPSGFRPGLRLDVPGALHADRPHQDRPFQGRVHLLEDQAHPRGVHPGNRQRRPDPAGRRRQRRGRARPRRCPSTSAS